MNQAPDNIAIIFFSRTASNEAQHKKFFRGKGASEKIASELIHRTRKVARSTDFPLLEINEDQQVGSTFGEKLTSALQLGFDKGFDKLIVIGNDSPSLGKGHLLHVAKALENKKIATCPAKDGGIGLLGITKNGFCKSVLLQLPWQTDQLFNVLIARIEECVVLPFVLHDLDSWADIISGFHLLRKDFSNLLLLMISLITSYYKRNYYLPYKNLKRVILQSASKRPPPQLSLITLS